MDLRQRSRGRIREEDDHSWSLWVSHKEKSVYACKRRADDRVELRHAEIRDLWASCRELGASGGADVVGFAGAGGGQSLSVGRR